jgi:exonuclease VII small subunit
MRDACESKDAILRDMSSAKQLSFNLEAGKEELQRYISQIESEKMILNQQIKDLHRQMDLHKQQVEFERVRFSELEMVLADERRALHEKDFLLSNMERDKEDIR